MKRNISVICLFIFSMFFYSCATSSYAAADSYEDIPSEKKSVLMYDECPELTPSLSARIELRATVENYNGCTTAFFSSAPKETELKPLFEYYSYCDKIRNSLEKFYGKKYNLKFNSQKDGIGIDIDLSDSKKSLESVSALLQSDDNEIHAFYFESENEMP